jgi:type IV secretion system protein VirB4
MTLSNALGLAFRVAAPAGVAQKRREQPVRRFIPYIAHYDESTLLTEEDQLVQIIRLDGLAFQTQDEDTLRRQKRFRNRLLRSLAKSDLGVTIHIVRRKDFHYPEGTFPNSFCIALDAAWREKHEQAEHYVNELYLSLIKLPYKSGVLVGAKDRLTYLSHKRHRGRRDQWRRRCAWDLQDASERVVQSLAAYGARLLKMHRKDDGWYSEPLRFLNYLVNWQDAEVRVPRLPIRDYLGKNRPIFGTEAMEMRGWTRRQLGAFLSVKEYPDATDYDMLDRFLNLPVEMVITQSYHFEDRPTSTKEIDYQQRRLDQADDKAADQISGLTDAMSDVAGGRVAMGWHHLSVLVKAADNDLASLDRALVAVEDCFTDLNIQATRETLNLEACFWAQLPGNFQYVARKRRISTANLAGFASLHNFPRGRAEDNWWGSAVTVLETQSKTPFYLNFHVGGGAYPPGHVHIAAPTGTGKSTLLNLLLGQAQRANPRIFYFDDKNGGEIFARACGATVSDIALGEPSGFNPLALPDSPVNRAFLAQWLENRLSINADPLHAVERELVQRAVDGMYRHAPLERSLVEIASYFGLDRDGALRSRLGMWLPGGKYSGLFDNDEDRFRLDARFCYFNTTRVVQDERAFLAVLEYVFHRIDLVMDGEPFIIVLEEGWKLRRSSYFRARIDDWLMTIRKKNGIVIFVTPDLSLSFDEKSDSLVKQPVTFLYFANGRAEEHVYRDIFGLSQREFQLVRAWQAEERLALVKQGDQSVVVRTALDTPGIARLLPVLSGNEGNVRLMRELIRRVGSEEPEAWLPQFLEVAR